VNLAPSAFYLAAALEMLRRLASEPTATFAAEQIDEGQDTVGVGKRHSTGKFGAARGVSHAAHTLSFSVAGNPRSIRGILAGVLRALPTLSFRKCGSCVQRAHSLASRWTR
jgi:hypothetical protein